jgi:hypothetical protein
MNEPKSPEKKKSKGKALTSKEKIAAAIEYLETKTDIFFFIGFEKDSIGFRYARQGLLIWSLEIAFDLINRIRDEEAPKEKIDPRDKAMNTQIATIDSLKIPYFYIDFAYERSVNYQYKLSGLRKEYLAMLRRMLNTILEIEVGQWHVRNSTPAAAQLSGGVARLDDGLIQ